MSKYVIDGEEFKSSSEYKEYLINYEGTKVLRKSTLRPLKLCIRDDGYLGVRTSQNNKPKNSLVHVMVMLAWKIEDRTEDRCVINHIDGNKCNPHGDNLEWVTSAENQRHALREGLKQKGEALYNSSLKDGDVHEICKLLTDGLTVKSLADRYNVKPDNIRKIRDGSCYFHIRKLYTQIPHTFKNEFSESTVRWVCSEIVKGVSDKNIAKNSSNKSLTTIDVKRIRHKIRYSSISEDYF